MGTAAGTGIQARRFAEGGDTSSPSSSGFSLAKANEAHTKALIDPGSFQGEPTTFGAGQMGMGMGGGGFGGINPAAIKADPRAFGIGPAASSLARDLARDEMQSQMQSQRQIYRPEYQNYGAGLGATPQAEYLASLLGNQPFQQFGTFTPQMPTFTRPSAPVVQPAVNSGFSIFGKRPQSAYSVPMGVPQEALRRSPFGMAPLEAAIKNRSLTQEQYDMMMDNPSQYLPYAQSIAAGKRARFQPLTSIPYMTAKQRDAYNKSQAKELAKLLGPSPDSYASSDG